MLGIEHFYKGFEGRRNSHMGLNVEFRFLSVTGKDTGCTRPNTEFHEGNARVFKDCKDVHGFKLAITL